MENTFVSLHIVQRNFVQINKAVPLGVALTLALQKSAADSARTAPGSNEGSFQDYLDFGK